MSRKSRSSILPSTKKLGGEFQQFFPLWGGGGGNGEIWTDQPSKVRMPKGLSRGGC